MIKHIWFGKCDCGKVYFCPSGLSECCGVLTHLVKDAKGTEYAPEKKEVGRFIDPEFDMFQDIAKEQKNNHYYNIWANEQENK